MEHAHAIDSLVLGYDPGGDGNHGVAALCVEGNSIIKIEVSSKQTVETAITWFEGEISANKTRQVSLGVDTLTVWCTGKCGWRPADRRLREAYPAAANSIVAPNSLYGAMAVNGMMLMTRLRERNSALVISEAHPKVMYYALASTRYDYSSNAVAMRTSLAGWLEFDGPPLGNEHEWDALASAYAIYQGQRGRWTTDLHTLPTNDGESLVWPAGRTHFYWPAIPVR